MLRGGHRSWALGATLVQVAVEKVEAAGVAAFFDLAEGLRDEYGRVLFAAGARVVAVGVDQGGAVARDDALGRWPGSAGVAFDGVQGEVQASGAFQQADALVQEAVDPVPAFEGGLLAYAAG